MGVWTSTFPFPCFLSRQTQTNIFLKVTVFVALTDLVHVGFRFGGSKNLSGTACAVYNNEEIFKHIRETPVFGEKIRLGPLWFRYRLSKNTIFQFRRAFFVHCQNLILEKWRKKCCVFWTNEKTKTTNFTKKYPFTPKIDFITNWSFAKSFITNYLFAKSFITNTYLHNASSQTRICIMLHHRHVCGLSRFVDVRIGRWIHR